MSDAMLTFVRSELRAIKPALRETLTMDAHFRIELNLDSLDLVELVARIEQRYSVLIPDADLPLFTSLDATVRYVSARLPP